MYLYMSGLEVNKILASIIFAILIVTLIGHFGDLIIDTEHHDQKETAYKIDVEELPSSEGVAIKKEEIRQVVLHWFDYQLTVLPLLLYPF